MSNDGDAPYGAKDALQVGDVAGAGVTERGAVRCRRCGDVYGDRDEAEGCRDFHCPMQEN
jgi:hypothetical protein